MMWKVHWRVSVWKKYFVIVINHDMYIIDISHIYRNRLPIYEIYIDTRYRTSDSRSSSNFMVELLETLRFTTRRESLTTGAPSPPTQ